MRYFAIARSDGGVSILVDRDGRDIPAEVAKWEEVNGSAVSWGEVSGDDIPADRTFRSSWKLNGSAIEHDMAKVKILAHDKRRAMRAAEMAPHDEVIAKRVPGTDAERAEGERVRLRVKYADMQSAIDGAATATEAKDALEATYTLPALEGTAASKERALAARRINELETGTLAQQVEALKLRLSLIEGG
jgi:hypothetical protein